MVGSLLAFFLPRLRFFFAFLYTCQKNLKQISLGIVSLLLCFSLGEYLKHMAVNFLYDLAMPCSPFFYSCLATESGWLVFVACKYPYF